MSEQELSKLISKLHRAQEDNDKKKEIDALMKLSEYHFNNEDYYKAKLSLNQILKLDSNAVNVNYYLALIELQLKNLDAAEKFIDREIKINPLNLLAKDLKDKLHINANFPLVTLFLFIISFFVYIFTFPKISLLYSIKFGVSEFNIFNGITSLFFHVNSMHFLVNMIILVTFGLILEKNIGSFKFLLVYLISGVVGNLLQFLFFDGMGIVLGASAALFGMLGAIMMREPLFEVRVLGFFRVPLILVLGGFFLISTLINLYLNLEFISGDVAHFIGLITGIFVISFFYMKSIPIFYNWLFVSIGFWVIQFSIQNIILENYYILNNILGDLILIIIGIMLIFYSYSHLKLSHSFEVI